MSGDTVFFFFAFHSFHSLAASVVWSRVHFLKRSIFHVRLHVHTCYTQHSIAALYSFKINTVLRWKIWKQFFSNAAVSKVRWWLYSVKICLLSNTESNKYITNHPPTNHDDDDDVGLWTLTMSLYKLCKVGLFLLLFFLDKCAFGWRMCVYVRHVWNIFFICDEWLMLVWYIYTNVINCIEFILGRMHFYLHIFTLRSAAQV